MFEKKPPSLRNNRASSSSSLSSSDDEELSSNDNRASHLTSESSTTPANLHFVLPHSTPMQVYLAQSTLDLENSIAHAEAARERAIASERRTQELVAILRTERELYKKSKNKLAFVDIDTVNTKKIAALKLSTNVKYILDTLLTDYSFLCTISYDIMSDAVYLESNPEQFYERKSIEKQISLTPIDPTTKTKNISINQIQPAKEMQTKIDHFVDLFVSFAKTEKFKKLVCFIDDPLANSSENAEALKNIIISIITGVDNKFTFLPRPEINISSDVAELRTEGTRQRLMITWPGAMGYTANAAPPILQNMTEITEQARSKFGSSCS